MRRLLATLLITLALAATASAQSPRAAESSRSAGHESTIACRLASILYVIRASGNAASTRPMATNE